MVMIHITDYKDEVKKIIGKLESDIAILKEENRLLQLLITEQKEEIKVLKEIIKTGDYDDQN